MKKSVAKKWVAALRSGKYRQGKRRLRVAGDTRKQDSFCCLGVLCDVYRTETGKGRWYLGAFEPAREAGSAMVAPDTVIDWAGLASCNPDVSVAYGNGTKAVAVAELNDLYGKTFAEIADLIETNWEVM